MASEDEGKATKGATNGKILFHLFCFSLNLDIRNWFLQVEIYHLSITLIASTLAAHSDSSVNRTWKNPELKIIHSIGDTQAFYTNIL